MDDKMMKINLLIDNLRYPLNIPREEEERYRDAAKMINNTLNKYRSMWPELSANNHWAMAALEIAFNLTTNENRNDTKPYMEKLEELTKELDNYISRK
jgi:cell division protein ZapA